MYNKSNVIKMKIWVLVFRFMYLVSVDPMVRSYLTDELTNNEWNGML